MEWAFTFRSDVEMKKNALAKFGVFQISQEGGDFLKSCRTATGKPIQTWEQAVERLNELKEEGINLIVRKA